MGWGSNVFPLLIVTSSGGFTGLFVYNPGPGAGNLIDSIAARAGTDPYGNAYVQGIASYGAGTPADNVQLTAGGIVFNQAAVNAAAVAGSNPTASLILSSGRVHVADAESNVSIVPGVAGALGNVSVQVGDTNTYDVARLTLFTTTNQFITSTSNTVITGMSKPVAIGSYHFRGIIRSQQGATNVNQLIGFTGPATSQAIWFYKQSNSSAGAVMSVTTGVSGLSTVGIGYGAVSATNYFEFEGVATFTAAGTFSAVAAEGTAGDSFTVQQGSILELEPVVAS